MSKTTIDVVFPLSIRAARDIIGEADSAYWLNDYAPAWDLDKCRLIIRKRGGSGESTVRAKALTITHASIAGALSAALAGRANRLPGENCRRLGATIVEGLTGSDGCGADGPAKDALLQIAVFGSVVYG